MANQQLKAARELSCVDRYERSAAKGHVLRAAKRSTSSAAQPKAGAGFGKAIEHLGTVQRGEQYTTQRGYSQRIVRHGITSAAVQQGG